jgi:hypothetical protein
MITEIFVSLDGFNFLKLDLDKSESIPLRLTYKDTQDFSKIFSPYSLGFTFTATPNNLKALNYFGNTDLKRTAVKIRCKIYVNSILAQNGFLKLEKIKYQNGKPQTITASFASTMTNLRDKFGNDTLRDFGSKLITWRPLDVFARLNGMQNTEVEGVALKWFVPLASTKRVWNADEIAYDISNSVTSENLIKSDELRPAISFTTLLDLIKQKYQLQIISPIESRSEVKDLFVWCMGEQFGNIDTYNQFILKANLGDTELMNPLPFLFNPRKSVFSSNITNQSFKIVVNPDAVGYESYYGFTIFKLEFTDVVLPQQNQNITIGLFKLNENEPFIFQTFTLNSGNQNFEIQISDDFLINNELEFRCKLSFDSFVSWTNVSVSMFVNWVNTSVSVSPNALIATSPTNDNVNEMNTFSVDLIKALPEIKVVDFLTSYFKAFNIVALDVSPLNDSLYWYTPEDILANKKTVTYIAENQLEKSTQDEFDYFVFKHKDSEFRSNKDYEIGAGMPYAQASFPEIKPQNAKEYRVETQFTIIPPVTIVNTSDIVTYYGFSEVDSPNFGELPIFYSHGIKPLNRLFGVQSSLVNGSLTNIPLSQYVKVMPFTFDSKSIGFSVLVWQNQALRDNLFSRYYAEIIQRLVNPNVMKQDFSLILNANEVRDFRLENDIIINEDKFTVIDSTIDITTGKTKLTLLNY